MGPEGEIEISEEAMDASNAKKREAVEFYSNGEYEKAAQAYTEAILLNPGNLNLLKILQPSSAWLNLLSTYMNSEHKSLL